MSEAKKEKTARNYSGDGMILGLVFGSGLGMNFGLIFGESIFGDAGTGLVLGMCFGQGIGMVIGMVIGSTRGNSDLDNEPSTTK